LKEVAPQKKDRGGTVTKTRRWNVPEKKTGMQSAEKREVKKQTSQAVITESGPVHNHDASPKIKSMTNGWGQNQPGYEEQFRGRVVGREWCKKKKIPPTR